MNLYTFALLKFLSTQVIPITVRSIAMNGWMGGCTWNDAEFIKRFSSPFSFSFSFFFFFEDFELCAGMCFNICLYISRWRCAHNMGQSFLVTMRIRSMIACLPYASMIIAAHSWTSIWFYRVPNARLSASSSHPQLIFPSLNYETVILDFINFDW